MAHLRSRAVAAIMAAVVAGCGAAPESDAPANESLQGEAALAQIAPPENTIHISGVNTPGTRQILDGALANTYAVRRWSGASRAHVIGDNGASKAMQACGHLVCSSGATTTSIPINVTLQSTVNGDARFSEVTVATLPANCSIFTVDLTVGAPGGAMSIICGFL